MPGSTEARQLLAEAEQATPEQQEALLDQASRLAADPKHNTAADQSVLLTAQGLLHRLALDFPASGTVLLQAERKAEQHGDPSWLARVRMHLGAHYALVGDFQRAIDTASQSRVALAPELLPRLLSNMAALHMRREDGPAAMAAFDEALAAAEAIADYNVIVTILNNRGSWHTDTGNSVDAEVDLRRGLLYSGTDVEPFRLASLQHNLGLTLTRQGFIRAGLSEMDLARDLLENRGENEVNTRLDRVEALLRARLLAEAEADALDILAKVDDAGLRPVRADALLLTAQIAVAMGDDSRARSMANEATLLFADLGRELGHRQCQALTEVLAFDHPLPEGFDATDLMLAEALLLRADHASGRSEAEVAWSTIQTRPVSSSRDLMLANYAGARLAQQRSQLAEASECIDRCFDDLSEVASEFNSLEIRRRSLTSIVPIQTLATELAVQLEQPDAFARWLTAARVAVEGRPQTAEGSPELIARLEALQTLATSSAANGPAAEAHQRRLQERIQMIARAATPSAAEPTTQLPSAATGLFFGTDGTSIFGLVDRRSPIVELGPVEAFLNLLDRLEFAVSLVARDYPPAGERQVAAVQGIAQQIDDLLLKPLSRWLPDEPLAVTAAGLVAGFPWRLLPTLRDHVVSLTQGPRPSPLPDEPHAAVVVGPNVQAENEIETIRRCYPHVEVLDGGAASVRAVRDLFGRADLVHVAAHGSLHGDDPLLSSLELADGSFTLYDIEALPRLPHTVVLASCRIAGETLRDTGYGLGSVLMSGGTRQVVATAQPLGERFVPDVMDKLHRSLAATGDASQALARLSFDDPLLDIAARSLIVLR